MKAQRPEVVFHGNGVSPGIIIGTALKLDTHNRVVLKLRVGEDNVEKEVKRFERAVELSREQLEGLKARFEEKVGREHSYILDAHLLMLEDHSLLSEIQAHIRRSHVNAEWAVLHATERIRKAYDSLEDEYFRERGSDIENVVERVLFNLSGERQANWARLPDDLVLVSSDFNPSTFALIDLSKVRGLALESGGRTSHTAIIARSLRLPAVTEIRNLLSSVTTGDLLLLDADEGKLIVNPTIDQMDQARARLEEFRVMRLDCGQEPGFPAVTRDGVEVTLLANTELPHEVRAARRSGAQGIGLFRSEFLFFAHPNGFPGMQEQMETYRLLAQEMHPYPVAIRTLDAGGDQSSVHTGSSGNPSMGLRGIRLSLKNRDLFVTQIEAVIRAAEFGRMEIVLPMISSVEEIWEAKEIIRRVHEMLNRAQVRINHPIPIGVMIEVPSAVLTIETLAQEADFLCVGTNDLIQYTLAVDRNNPDVSHMFQPLHPSIIHSLDRIAEVARLKSKPVRICGEVASNPFFAALLLGMGFNNLSMNAYSIPTIRDVVRSLSLEYACSLATSAKACKTGRAIADLLLEDLPRMVHFDLAPYMREIRSPGDRASLSHVS